MVRVRWMACAAGAMMAIAGAASLFSQAPTRSAGQVSKSPQQAFILQSQTNVVLVDVRVVDKTGKPVTDLKQSDFSIREDGVQQTITSFSLEDVEKLAQVSGGNERPQIIDLAKLPPQANAEQVLQNHRLLVFFFDLSSMAPDELMRALKASSDFLKTRMTPADLIAVVTYSSNLRVVQNFTNDRDSLSKVLRTILVGEESSALSAHRDGGRGRRHGRLGTLEIVTQDLSDAYTPDETEFNIFNTDEKLAAIESLANMLKVVPGRKNVIHFSSGITRTGQENQAQLRSTISAANQADVSLYTMDARGLLALPPGGDASSASPSGTALYAGTAHVAQVSAMQSSRETLASLSTDTGGRTFYDLNDFTPAFEEVQKENSSYYLLGYTPSNTRSDGRFRHIRVEVNRPGLKVQARPGYFAPKNFRQFTREDKELQLEQAMDLDVPFVDLPLVIETDYFYRPDKKFALVLSAKIPGSEVSFLQKAGKHDTEFDFAWKVTDAKNHTVAGLRDTLPVKMTDDTFEEIISSNLFYEGQISLPPGRYNLKAVVRENEGGKIGTFEVPLDVPEVPDTGMSLSSVVLSNEVKPSAELARAKMQREKDAPLQVGNRSVLPSVTRVFRTNQTLSVYLESYAAKTPPPAAGEPPAPATPPSVALVFFCNGRKIAGRGRIPANPRSPPTTKRAISCKFPCRNSPPAATPCRLTSSIQRSRAWPLRGCPSPFRQAAAAHGRAQLEFTSPV